MTGQRAQLAEAVGPIAVFVRVYPYNLASRQRNNSAVPIPLHYIVMLEPDVKVTQNDGDQTDNDVQGASVSW